MFRRLPTMAAGLTTGCLLLSALVAGAPTSAGVSFVPLAVMAPDTVATTQTPPLCTTPAPIHHYAGYHCYTPADIAAAYGVDNLRKGNSPLLGDGQTIVLVDSYGSPTMANDLQVFHDTFFSGLPNPSFEEIYPFGNPTANYTCTKSAGLSGPCSAAGWSEEATLDVEWAYAIAPKAHIVLLATPPAETLGVPGLPNMFKGIQQAIDKYPKGTVFSQSFGLAEQTFGGAALNQMNDFNRTYANGIAKGDSFLASSGDQGNGGNDKNHKLSGIYSTTVVGFPAVSPLVTAVGGTQLMYGWTWAPKVSGPAFDPTTGAPNPDYFNSVDGGTTEAVWNECGTFGGGNCVTGGGTSSYFGAPSWQSQQLSLNNGMRSIPDLSWNAAVNGGVLIYISAYSPAIRKGWHVIGGTSAASPQMAGVIALANEARANNGLAPLGNLGPHIYALGDADANSATGPDASFAGNGTSIFRDIVPHTFGAAAITLDNNQWTDPAPPYKTTPGYDMTTGFGSPRADLFVEALGTQVLP